MNNDQISSETYPGTTNIRVAYFLAEPNGAAARAVALFEGEAEADAQNGHGFARRFGCEKMVWSTRRAAFGITGGPCPDGWKSVERYSGIYVPGRRTKVARALHDEMVTYNLPTANRLEILLFGEAVGSLIGDAAAGAHWNMVFVPAVGYHRVGTSLVFCMPFVTDVGASDPSQNRCHTLPRIPPDSRRLLMSELWSLREAAAQAVAGG